MKVEHPIGLEPITRCLQGSRSTIELREQIAGIRGPAPHQEECQGKFVFYLLLLGLSMTRYIPSAEDT